LLNGIRSGRRCPIFALKNGSGAALFGYDIGALVAATAYHIGGPPAGPQICGACILKRPSFRGAAIAGG
jgi:hypothetical protein